MFWARNVHPDFQHLRQLLIAISTQLPSWEAWASPLATCLSSTFKLTMSLNREFNYHLSILCHISKMLSRNMVNMLTSCIIWFWMDYYNSPLVGTSNQNMICTGFLSKVALNTLNTQDCDALSRWVWAWTSRSLSEPRYLLVSLHSYAPSR